MKDPLAVRRCMSLELERIAVSHFSAQTQCMAFPLDKLDPRIRRLVSDIQQRTQAAPELIVSTLFSAMALACQDVVDVNPVADIVYPTSIYTIVAADSGERKSSVLRIVQKPFQKAMKVFAQQHQNELEQYDQAHSIWKTKCSGLCAALKSAVKNGESFSNIENELSLLLKEKPVMPEGRQWLCNDVTGAGIKYAIATSGGSIGIFADEAAALINGAFLKDPSLLNNPWNGEPLIATRAGKPIINTTNLDYRFSLCLMMQRQPFRKYLETRGYNAWETGFLARCLFCDPPKPSAMPCDNDDEIICDVGSEENAIDEFYKDIEGMLNEGIQRRKDGRKRKRLSLTPQGQKSWGAMYKTTMKKISQDGEWNKFSGFGSKFMEHVSRLAAVMECFTTKGDFISEQNLESAISVVDWYFQSMAFNFGSLARSEQETLAQLLDDWFLKNRKAGILVHKKNDLLQKGPYELRNKKHRDMALEYLVARDWVELYEHDGISMVRYIPNLIHTGEFSGG